VSEIRCLLSNRSARTVFLLQDETGSIVIKKKEAKFNVLDLSAGKFVIVTGVVNVPPEGGHEIDATRISVRKRPGQE